MPSDRLSQLSEMLRTGAIDQRKAALDELAGYPAEQAIAVLQPLATAPDFLCRRFAVMGLGNHRVPAAFTALTNLLETEPDSNVLAEIANSLFEFGAPAVPILQQLFAQNDHWLLRQTVLSILMEADQDQVLLETIQLALQDPTPSVRETAILALGRLLRGPCQTAALDLLIELAAAEQWRDRWRAATALTLATDAKARPVLAKLQKDENHYVVAAALEVSLPPN